jgi:hypothetical protein
VLVVALSQGGSDGTSGHPTGPAAPGVSPSTSDDWQRAVCKPGTFFNGGRSLRNATGSASCQSPTGGLIAIGTYSSQFALENDMAIYRGRPYATTPTDSGETYVFLEMNGSGEALSPLESFGFTIHSGR